MSARGDRARPQGALGSRRERSRGVRADRAAGEGGARGLKARPDRQRSLFLRQAAYCDGRSPLYAGLCRLLAEEPLVAPIVPELRWDDPLRLFGAVHLLVLSGEAPALAAAYGGGDGEAWPAFREVLLERRDELARAVATQQVQTNEVQRCAALLPGFLEVARRIGPGVPLDLVELGPSAGLNLFWDRYRYDVGGLEWGAAGAAVRLTIPAEPRPPGALFELRPEVRSRVGIDLDPVDVTTEAGALLLQSFVWADQHERLERLRSAIATVRRDPPELVRGDYVESLPGILASRAQDGLTVVFQTASTQYLSEAQYERLARSLEAAARTGPLAWLSTLRHDEASDDRGYTLGLRLWPDGRRERLAGFGFHGEWLEWRERS